MFRAIARVSDWVGVSQTSVCLKAQILSSTHMMSLFLVYTLEALLLDMQGERRKLFLLFNRSDMGCTH
jgi:hypothetical protein